MATLGERLKAFREERGLSQRDLAARSRITQAAIHKIETGMTREPSASTVVGLSKALMINPEELMPGMGKASTPASAEIIDATFAKVPLYGPSVAAGYTNGGDVVIEDYISIRIGNLKPDGLFVVRAKGDCMIGAGILDGSLVVVDSTATSYHGRVVVACVGGEFSIKRCKVQADGVWLYPENPQYEAFKLAAEDKILGVVVRVEMEMV